MNVSTSSRSSEPSARSDGQVLDVIETSTASAGSRLGQDTGVAFILAKGSTNVLPTCDETCLWEQTSPAHRAMDSKKEVVKVCDASVNISGPSPEVTGDDTKIRSRPCQAIPPSSDCHPHTQHSHTLYRPSPLSQSHTPNSAFSSASQQIARDASPSTFAYSQAPEAPTSSTSLITNPPPRRWRRSHRPRSYLSKENPSVAAILLDRAAHGTFNRRQLSGRLDGLVIHTDSLASQNLTTARMADRHADAISQPDLHDDITAAPEHRTLAGDPSFPAELVNSTLLNVWSAPEYLRDDFFNHHVLDHRDLQEAITDLIQACHEELANAEGTGVPVPVQRVRIEAKWVPTPDVAGDKPSVDVASYTKTSSGGVCSIEKVNILGEVKRMELRSRYCGIAKGVDEQIRGRIAAGYGRDLAAPTPAPRKSLLMFALVGVFVRFYLWDSEEVTAGVPSPKASATGTIRPSNHSSQIDHPFFDLRTDDGRRMLQWVIRDSRRLARGQAVVDKAVYGAPGIGETQLDDAELEETSSSSSEGSTRSDGNGSSEEYVLRGHIEVTERDFGLRRSNAEL